MSLNACWSKPATAKVQLHHYIRLPPLQGLMAHFIQNVWASTGYTVLHFHALSCNKLSYARSISSAPKNVVLQSSLAPVTAYAQEKAVRLSAFLQRQPNLDIAIPGNKGAQSWLLTTYLDDVSSFVQDLSTVCRLFRILV